MLPTPVTKEQILEQVKLTNILNYENIHESIVLNEDTLTKVKYVETVNKGIITKIYKAEFLWGAMCHVHAAKPTDLIAQLYTFDGYIMRCNLNKY